MADFDASAFSDSQQLSACSTWEAIGALFSQNIRKLGMTCCASGMVTGPKASSANPFHFTAWPEDWKRLYLSQGYAQIDPLPRYAIVSGLDASWSDVLGRLSRNDPGHKVYIAAAALGFTEGMVIPLRNARGDLGLMTMGGDRKNFTAEEVSYLRAISSAAFQTAELLNLEAEEVRLGETFTPRELDCISLLRQGFTDAEIGRILGIADRTVVSHLENARHKVGARSRAHLVSVTAQLVA